MKEVLRQKYIKRENGVGHSVIVTVCMLHHTLDLTATFHLKSDFTFSTREHIVVCYIHKLWVYLVTLKKL